MNEVGETVTFHVTFTTGEKINVNEGATECSAGGGRRRTGRGRRGGHSLHCICFTWEAVPLANLADFTMTNH